MEQKVPTLENKEEIMKALKETLPNRREEIIKENKFAGQILAKYPRLKDFKGEMVSNITDM
ncbi:MAG: hypothetical protein E6K54_08925 [Gammaproteobacteria bacterium]|nr:MAG: hypothetical protein E6K54_08925 [Gammaproteobacteria bacterium]